MTATRRQFDQPTLIGPSDLLAALGGLDCAGAAEVYAACGYPVVPMHTAHPGGACSCPAQSGCSEAGKHPRLAAWPRLAATEPATVRGWWQRWPAANLGLATGRRFDVLDLDGPKGWRRCAPSSNATPWTIRGRRRAAAGAAGTCCTPPLGWATASGCWRGWTGAAKVG